MEDFAQDGIEVIRLHELQPIIIDTTMGYHALLELNKDGSIYIYLLNGEIIKISDEEKSDQLFDTSRFLTNDWTAMDESKVPEEYLQGFHLMTNEQKTYLISTNADNPPNLDPKFTNKPIPPAKFINFDIPTATAVKCWYHPTNIWRRRKQTVYLCQKFAGTIYVQDEYTTKSPVLIQEVQTYKTIYAKHYLEHKIIVPTDRALAPTIHAVRRLITLHQIAHNKPDYRCRLDLENKKSFFWKDKPFNQRILECAREPLFHMPPEGLTLTEIAEVMEEQKKCTAHRFDDDNNGLSFLHEFKDSDGIRDFLFSREALRRMAWTHVKDAQARKRGFYFQAHLPHFTIFRNCKKLHEFVIRLEHKYTEYLMRHDGTRPIEVLPNFIPVLQEDQPFALGDDYKILVMDITTPEIEKDHCEEWIDPDPEETAFQIGITEQTQMWTPIITPCSPACHVPYQIAKLTTYEKRNPAFNRYRCIAVDTVRLDALPWFSTNLTCNIHITETWHTSILDKIPMYRCSAEPRLRGLHNLTARDEEAIGIHYGYTFSKEKGFSGLNPTMFKLAEEDEQPETLTPDMEWKAPTYPCAPGCVPPQEIRDIKIRSIGDIRQWYKDLALSIHILFQKPWEDTPELCDLNSSFCWQVIQFKALPVFKCSGHHTTNIATIYSPTHQNRWALAYCFTYHQLKTMKWERFQSTHRAKLHRAIISMVTLESTYYTVTNDLNQTCTFEVHISDIATPMDRTQLNLTHQKMNDYKRGLSADASHGIDVNWLRTTAEMERKNRQAFPNELKQQIEQILNQMPRTEVVIPHPLYRGAFVQSLKMTQRFPPIGEEIEETNTNFRDGTDISQPVEPTEEVDTTEIEAQLDSIIEEDDETLLEAEKERALQQFDKSKLAE